MATQAAVSGQATKNKGGTIKKAGNTNTTTGPITKSRTLMDDAVTSGYGAKVALSSGAAYSSGNLGTFNAKTTFAYDQVPGRYIMKKYTHYVNGVANTAMNSCASESSERMRSIAFIESTRTLGSGATTSFNPFTGILTKGGQAGHAVSFGLDHAARPTNAIPGELTYKTGSPTYTDWQDDYKPKTAP